MTSWETFHEEEVEGFHIEFSAAPEEDDPADHFEFEEDIEAVRSGRLEWFVVRCEAFKPDLCDEPPGTDYLGACAYTSASAFLDGDYDRDMVAEAIDQAKRELASRLPY